MVQMHSVAQKLSKIFNDAIPPEFTTFGNLTVTVEEFMPGKSVKYNNNDGMWEMARNDEFSGWLYA